MQQSNSPTVSPTNLEIVKAIYDAGKRGDIAAILARIAPEFQIVEADSLPYGGTHRGAEGLTNLYMVVFQTWRSFEFEVDRFLDAGDEIIAMLDARIGLRDSDRTATMPIAEFWKLKDGKAIEVRPFYFDTAALVGNPQPPASKSP